MLKDVFREAKKSRKFIIIDKRKGKNGGKAENDENGQAASAVL
jgi:hypothetical protein